MKNLCWWCGNQATTKEHKYKRSQISRMFESNEIIERFIDKDRYIVQGPNSQHLKFPVSLCNDCNNNRSQPFDRAFDKFIAYIDVSSEKIITEEKININEIYSDCREFYLFLGYIVKHICCRLDSADYAIPKNFIHFLNGKSHLSHLKISFGINKAVLEAQQTLRHQNISEKMFFLGDLLFWVNSKCFQSHLSHNWLFITYFISSQIEKVLIDYNEPYLKINSYFPEEVINKNL